MDARPCGCADRFVTEIVWDAGLSGTGAAPDGRSITVGSGGGWAPEHLLLLAAESCVMRTMLALASGTGIDLLGYVSSAELRPTPANCDDVPPITIAPCIVVATEDEAARTLALGARAVRESPVARLLGDRLSVRLDVRVVAAPAPP